MQAQDREQVLALIRDLKREAKDPQRRIDLDQLAVSFIVQEPQTMVHGLQAWLGLSDGARLEP